MNQKPRRKKWLLRHDRGDLNIEQEVARLCSDLKCSEIMARLLHTRGYKTPEQARSFLQKDEVRLHDPFRLKDMDVAVKRVEEALERGETIAIYGDYDVDGVTSVSLLYLYLTSRGGRVGYYIPSRSREGYGLSTPAIDRLKNERDVKLMITVDTGITANAETAYAKSLGIDTVITDHHECHNELPEACAVVNPHRPDDAYPFKELAGVGVVFKLVCALEMARVRREGGTDLEAVKRICTHYGDLVAIGTVADVMPIVDENRLIVAFGLRLISETKRHGLRALIDAAAGANTAKKKKINSSFIGFGIAPRMNAAGRVSSASIAVELLLSEDDESARALAEQLCELNVQRQVEENRIAEQAYKKIEHTMDPERDRVIVIDDDTWQQGIIGIVSSRITERYGLPSILISFDGSTEGTPCLTDLGKGSGRSIRGLNLVGALAYCEDLLVRFGGHELAAGLTIQRSNIDAFRARINEYAREQLDEEMLCLSLDADCKVEMNELTMQLAQELDLMEPFGISNPVPTFMATELRVLKTIPMAGGKHTKLIVEKNGITMNAIWFGISTSDLPFEENDPIDVLFQLNVNEYQGTTSLQMIVQDVRISPAYEEAFKAQIHRYEEIRGGARFEESEDVIPTREDFVPVYKTLRREYYAGRTMFHARQLLSVLRGANGEPLNYVKLRFMIRIMQELQLCEVEEYPGDLFQFSFQFRADKTNIEKSSILRKLRLQTYRE